MAELLVTILVLILGIFCYFVPYLYLREGEIAEWLPILAFMAGLIFLIWIVKDIRRTGEAPDWLKDNIYFYLDLIRKLLGKDE